MANKVPVSIQIDPATYSRLERIRVEEHRPSMSNTIASILERAIAQFESVERGDTQIDVAEMRRRVHA